MSKPIVDQVRSYFEDLEAQAGDCAPRVPASAPVVVDLDFEPQSEREEKMSRNGWLVSVAAAAIFVVLIVVAFWGGDSTSTIEPADLTPETSDEPVAPIPTVAAAEPELDQVALAVVQAWYAAADAGDIAAMEALWTQVEGESSTAVTREGHLKLMAWDVAQGSVDSERSCSAERPTAEGEVLVTCEFLDQYAVHDLVGAPPIAVVEDLYVRPDGSVRLIMNSWDPAAYSAVNVPFADWLAVHIPGEEAVAGWGFDSVDHARQVGERRLELGRLWAGYLEESGCTYDAPCE